LEANVEGNKLNETFATHEDTDSARLSNVKTGDLGHNRASKEFGEERYNANQDNVTPGDTIVKKAQISFETGESKVLEVCV
jgi:hypothetical protein